jgi:hypothetical protein
MFALPCFVLAVLALPFKSKSRPEAENVALRQQLIVFGVRCAAGPDLQTAITGSLSSCIDGFRRSRRLSLSEIKCGHSDDAGRRGRASLRSSRGCELVVSSAHPCSTTGGFGSDCSSSHNSAADGEDGVLQKQSRGPNSPVGSNRSPARNMRSARVSGSRSADPGCPSPGCGS